MTAATPYDQQALELCPDCGWKAIIPGEPCLNCGRGEVIKALDAYAAERDALAKTLEAIEAKVNTLIKERDALAAAGKLALEALDKGPMTYFDTHEAAITALRQAGVQ